MKIGSFILAFLFLSVSAAAQPANDITSLLEKGDTDGALAKINAALKTKPNDQNLLSQKIRVLVIKKQYAETELLAGKLLARNPKNKIALNARGVARRDGTKDYKGALADFDKALAVDAEYPQASFNRALTLFYGQLGNKSEALDAFSYAIEINPENATARSLRGRLYNEFGRYKLALLDLNKALSINNALPVYSDRAYAQLLLYVSGERSLLPDAAKDAEIALRADASNGTALAIQALVKVARSDNAGALADAQKALQIDANNYLAHIANGYVKNSNKDIAGAFNDFETAFKIVPNSNWAREEYLSAAEKARKSNPKAETVYREQFARKIQNSRDKVELLKLTVEDEPWNYEGYNKLDNTWKDLYRLLGKTDEKALNPPEQAAEMKAIRNYWYGLHAKTPKNVCVALTKYSYFDLDENGLYNENRKKTDRTKLNYLQGELANYDGTNGAECAARIALFIAEIYQTVYSPEKNFDLAKQFAERSKQIKADLKDDPNTISGAGSTADESLNNIAYWKAQDDAWKKDLERMKQSGTSSAEGSSGRRRSGIDPAKEQAAINAYERVHPQIERFAEQIISAAGKVQSGGSMSFVYKGTRARMTNLQRQMVDIYYKFIEVYGDNLPDSLLNHLKSDVRRVGNLTNDYTTGQVYEASGACSGGWNGYGC
jgi:tetratricopeptide (TPR) repeat protein